MERPTGAAFANASQLNGWRILGMVGLGFLIMSMLDLTLGWYPIDFGSPSWEFGTISATVAALSIPVLSLFLIMASGMALDRPKVVKAVGIGMIVMALFLAGLGVLWLTNVPLALKATSANQVVNFGVKKAIAKSLLLFTGYEILLVLGAVKALRRSTTA